MANLLFGRDKKAVEITVSTRTIIRAVVVVAAAILFIKVVSISLHTLTLIGIAIFLSLALNAPVRWLANHLPGKRRGSRSLATALSIGIVLLLLVGFMVAVVPPLTKQTVSFARNVPQLVEDTRSGQGPVGRFVVKYNLEKQVEKLSSQLSERFGNIGGSAIGTVSKIGNSIFTALTVMVLTVMMIVEGPAWRKLFEEMLPARQRPRVFRLARDMNKVVQGYVNGQVLLAAIAAMLIVPMLFIAGVSYPIALMVVVFICGLIPMVGHTLGAIICTLVALFTSVPAALIVLGYYILYQQIENYVVQPRIQANSTNMSPLLVFMSVIIGVNFGGLLGGLVAIPVAGCIRIVVLDYLQERDILSTKTVKAAKTEPDTV